MCILRRAISFLKYPFHVRMYILCYSQPHQFHFFSRLLWLCRFLLFICRPLCDASEETKRLRLNFSESPETGNGARLGRRWVVQELEPERTCERPSPSIIHSIFIPYFTYLTDSCFALSIKILTKMLTWTTINFCCENE